ncbi:MAG: nuclear transport factor 2 family protein [bacterium]|nr:nuclear transport factor 2 family protein [bacterium]
MKNLFLLPVLLAFTAVAAAAPADHKAAGIAVAPAQVATPERGREAQAALNDFLRAYERGDIAGLQRSLDPALIGYGQLLDGVQADAARYRQMRVTLSDVQVMAGPEVAVVQAHWQKRFLAVNSFQPVLQEGNAMFMLHGDSDGWRLAAVAGDTPFAGGGGVLAQVIFQPAVLVCPPASAACPVTLEVRDPDLAGQGTVSVVLATSTGDRETLTLTETMPGRFQLLPSSLSLVTSTPVANNGTVEVAPGAVLTASFVDENPGAGRPATPVTARIRLP